MVLVDRARECGKLVAGVPAPACGARGGYISGSYRTNEDGSTTLENGRLALFQNFDEHGNPLARPNTLLIDSEEIAVARSWRFAGRTSMMAAR
jgi:hypothetical protein